MPFITCHAAKRLKQRVGIKKSNLKSNLDKAYQYGLKYEDLVGSVKKYVEKEIEKGTLSEIRIFNQKVYLFKQKSAVLITVLHLPHEYHNVVEKLKIKRDFKNNSNSTMLRDSRLLA